MSFKRPVARGLFVASALITVVAVIFAIRIHAQMGTIHTASSIVAVPTFSAQHGQWVIGHPQPANVIMLWQENSYIGSTAIPSTPDNPRLGNIITEDLWAETNSSGAAIFTHTVSTLPNGTLLQETFDSNLESTIIRGPRYYDVHADDASNPFWGVTKSAPQLMGDETLPYVDSQELIKDAFTIATTTSASRPIPQKSLTMTGITPAEELAAPGSFQTWEAKGAAAQPSLIDSVRFDTDAQGRIIVTDIRKLNSDGTQLSDQWYSIGDVYFYASSQAHLLPAWVFAEPQQVKKGCQH